MKGIPHLLAVIIGLSFVYVPTPSADTVEARIESLCRDQQNPDIAGGFGVSAIKDGNAIFTVAYGTANNEYDLPLTTESAFDFASIGKMFTGWAVAKLVIEGKMSPDDDVHKYIPELPDFGYAITIYHLLHHTSGLRDWVGLMKLAGKQASDVHSKAVLLEVILNQRELNFPPGEGFAYSNTGYLLLAEAVAVATGRDFPGWCKDNIFKPLGMSNTGFLESYAEIVPNRAMAYKADQGKVYRNCYDQLASCGSSSLMSTLEDMTKWLLAVSERQFGGPEVWDLMLSSGTLKNGDRVGYGYGVSIQTYKENEKVGHGGSWLGYLSDLVYYPEKGVGYVLMITRVPPAVSISGRLDDILLEIETPHATADERMEERRKENESESLDADRLPRSSMAERTGKYYSMDEGLLLEIREADGTMVMDFPWQSGMRVSVLPEDKFYLEKYGHTFAFKTESGGRVTGLEFILEDGNSYWRKLQSDPSEWKDLEGILGQYFSDEIKATYLIAEDAGSVTVKSLLNADVKLLQYDNNTCLGDAWWLSTIRFTRNNSGAVTGFLLDADNKRVSGLRFRKIAEASH